jgi:hypothetical protein
MIVWGNNKNIKNDNIFSFFVYKMIANVDVNT